MQDTAAGQDRDPDCRPARRDRYRPAGSLPPGEILRLAASLDQVSGHVLASAVVRAAAERDGRLVLPDEAAELAGQGIAERSPATMWCWGARNGPG